MVVNRGDASLLNRRDSLVVKSKDGNQLINVEGDPDKRGALPVQLYTWDADALEWVRWTGTIDAVVDGDLYVAMDDLEDYTEALAYYYVAQLEDGGYTYIGSETKAGAYRIARYDSNGDCQYAAGTGGLPSKAPATNWSALSYGDPSGVF
jgi:hypothetical protein